MVSDHPHSQGVIEDTFESTITVLPWENLEKRIIEKIEALHPVGYWSDLNLVSTTKI
ncbi:hypothetical protein [Edwardsiella phage PEi26]|uniref:Uncharacterized protein n=1 Tax=Edwardsiella phage PEi26 TaxID=1608311 RepID=A0A0B6VRM6_9CAUD|nr:hypothetical protein [Edwardsiella phage PEi26]